MSTGVTDKPRSNYEGIDWGEPVCTCDRSQWGLGDVPRNGGCWEIVNPTVTKCPIHTIDRHLVSTMYLHKEDG